MEITHSKEKIDYPLLREKGLTFGEDVKALPVFHYTSIGGLQGILSRKALRFTNIKYLNDKDETLAGLDSIVKENGFSEEQREKFRSSILNCGTQTFLCCFSLDGDSLPMWNYYTKEINNQGFNIAFDSKELVESILKNNPILDGCDFAFGNVDYTTDNESKYSKTITNEIPSSMESAILKLCLAVAKNAPAYETSGIDKSTFKDWEKKSVKPKKGKKKILFPSIPIMVENVPLNLSLKIFCILSKGIALHRKKNSVSPSRFRMNCFPKWPGRMYTSFASAMEF